MSWPIQTYTKFQLNTAYFPGIDSISAARRLGRWIKKNAALCKALADAGYRNTQHHYTSRQTALIFEYLGEP